MAPGSLDDELIGDAAFARPPSIRGTPNFDGELLGFPVFVWQRLCSPPILNNETLCLQEDGET